MTDLPELAASLGETAQASLERAWTILGHRPSGIDITITPTNPISDTWHVRGTSPCGIAWLERFYPQGPIKMSNRALALFKQEIASWGMTSHTEWGTIVELGDPL